MTRQRAVFAMVCAAVLAVTAWLFLNRPVGRNPFYDMVLGGSESSGTYLYSGIGVCLTIWMVWVVVKRRSARRWWLCRNCRYDLRPFKDASKVCPECGETKYCK